MTAEAVASVMAVAVVVCASCWQLPTRLTTEAVDCLVAGAVSSLLADEGLAARAFETLPARRTTEALRPLAAEAVAASLAVEAVACAGCPTLSWSAAWVVSSAAGRGRHAAPALVPALAADPDTAS